MVVCGCQFLNISFLEYVAEIENLYESFVKFKDNDANLKHRSCLLKIQRLFTLCKELGDEKIAIVQSVSDIIILISLYYIVYIVEVQKISLQAERGPFLAL